MVLLMNLRFNVLMKGETLQNIFDVLENDDHLPEKHNHLI